MKFTLVPWMESEFQITNDLEPTLQHQHRQCVLLLYSFRGHQKYLHEALEATGVVDLGLHTRLFVRERAGATLV